jgi:hypothetical protein
MMLYISNATFTPHITNDFTRSNGSTVVDVKNQQQQCSVALSLLPGCLVCTHAQVQQKRPYWQDRTWTDTDVGYLSFFAAMHAVALLGGPLTFSWDALHVMLGG